MIYVSGGLIRFVKLNTGEGERERESSFSGHVIHLKLLPPICIYIYRMHFLKSIYIYGWITERQSLVVVCA
jgi:hypothetical protein